MESKKITVNLFRKKCYKLYEYIVTKISRSWKQKTYMFNGVKLKYIYEKKKNCNELIVVFSSCTRKGIKARYNYIRTLSDVNVNKLFILDDFAADKRGSYYIGKSLEFDEEKATVELIKHMITITNVKRPIFCGSSKGGWASLYFGTLFENSIIISGAPQYYLGNYLLASGNIETMKHIIGDNNEYGTRLLNNYLEQRIENDEYAQSQKIFLHYSNKEHTYFEHIQYLIETLRKCSMDFECDIEDYEDHSLISLFYPSYLKLTLKHIFDDYNIR